MGKSLTLKEHQNFNHQNFFLICEIRCILVKLWIIYKDGIGFSKIIAEMLQDRLEDYNDVFVGVAKKIDPKFLIEVGLDNLIIGDVVKEEFPSLEIKEWLLKYCEMSSRINLILRILSGFCVSTSSSLDRPLWNNILKDIIKAKMLYPPLLHLKLNIKNYCLENGTVDLVKEYSDDFIKYIIKNEERND